MRCVTRKTLFFLMLLSFCAAAPCLVAQAAPAPAQTPDPGDQAKRQAALTLFSQGKRLEALPLLEELVQKSPEDPELLVALAASLVEHAATLTDQEAAAKERF